MSINGLKVLKPGTSLLLFLFQTASVGNSLLQIGVKLLAFMVKLPLFGVKLLQFNMK